MKTWDLPHYLGIKGNLTSDPSNSTLNHIVKKHAQKGSIRRRFCKKEAF